MKSDVPVVNGSNKTEAINVICEVTVQGRM